MLYLGLDIFYLSCTVDKKRRNKILKSDNIVLLFYQHRNKEFYISFA